MLTQYCSSCHANGNAQGGFTDVLDVPAMIARSLIKPGEPVASRVYTFVDSGVMPRSDKKPTRAEIDLLGAWISCGASDWNAEPAPKYEFMTIDERLSTVRRDLEQQPEADRERLRYLDLSVLANAGTDSAELERYRGVVSLLLNSLSSRERIAPPARVGRDALLLRIDLDDYEWDEATWDVITADYPYAIRYDREDRERDSAEIRGATGARVPLVHADWFLNHASRPPLYYDILRVPEDVRDYVGGFGVDLDADPREEGAVRAGFNGSGVSSNNRVIERHALSEGRAAFWLSYDFRNSVDARNIFANPLDFEQDGGEGIFNLPNGLQAYFLVNADFQRLDKAPTDIVADPSTRDGAVEAGLSCMGGCHLSRGIIAKDDQVHDAIGSNADSSELIERTRDLYVPVEQMRTTMAADADRYRTAVEATGFVFGDETAVIRRVRAHEALLGIESVAATAGVPAEELQAALQQRGDAFGREVAVLATPGTTLYRNVVEENFERVVRALRLGRPLDEDRDEESGDDSDSPDDDSDDSGG